MLSRRSFLNSTLGASLAVTTAQQQATAQTPAVQPPRKRLIVDAQVHLWKAESPDWPWVPGMKPQMPEPFTIENRSLDGDRVYRIVHSGSVRSARPSTRILRPAFRHCRRGSRT